MLISCGPNYTRTAAQNLTIAEALRVCMLAKMPASKVCRK